MQGDADSEGSPDSQRFPIGHSHEVPQFQSELGHISDIIKDEVEGVSPSVAAAGLSGKGLHEAPDTAHEVLQVGRKIAVRQLAESTTSAKRIAMTSCLLPWSTKRSTACAVHADSIADSVGLTDSGFSGFSGFAPK